MDGLCERMVSDVDVRDPAAQRREARTAVFGYIEAFYNRRRRHSRLGMRSPADFETTTLMPGGTSLAASRLAVTHRIRLTSTTAASAA
jgi:hypothetical protein